MVLTLKRVMIVAAWSDYWGLELKRATRMVGCNGVVGPLMFGIHFRKRGGGQQTSDLYYKKVPWKIPAWLVMLGMILALVMICLGITPV